VVSNRKHAPINPFQKTLKTMERSESVASVATPTANTTSTGRALMDVNSFKKLLMTGIAGASSSTLSSIPQAQAIHHGLGDGGSSTDTSSISRQSIFEPVQEAHLESPRTSHEVSEPDDERRRLTTEFQVSSTSARKKPPPPSSRHGKLIKVELRDDPTTNASESLSSGPGISQQYFGSSGSSPSRSQTDLNKPLPPAPSASHESDRESVFDREAAGKTPEPLSPSASIRRKTPPAPPLARRHSQLVSDSKLTRGDTGRLSPKAEEDSASVTGIEPNRPRSDSARAPPPPPSRRPGSIRGSSHHLPLPSPSTSTDFERPISKSGAGPPPPPTRVSSQRKSRSDRPPSISSMDISNTRASVIPPPPPPHRQRGSSGTSTDSSVLSLGLAVSGEHPRRSIDGTRRDSAASSVSRLERIETDSGEQDILADLSALQREIDALRNQSEKKGIT
jgi:hypothetical protein